jgi:hypothetical protein
VGEEWAKVVLRTKGVNGLEPHVTASIHGARYGHWTTDGTGCLCGMLFVGKPLGVEAVKIPTHLALIRAWWPAKLRTSSGGPARPGFIVRLRGEDWGKELVVGTVIYCRRVRIQTARAFGALRIVPEAVRRAGL